MNDEQLKDCVIRMEEQMKFINEKIETVHEILKSGPKKYAPKWVMYPVMGVTGIMLTWIVNQWLDIIPKAYALFLIN